MIIKQATARLNEWANFSYPLAYIAKCLQQVMTEEVAGWVMQEGKSAKGLWDYLYEQAKKENQPGQQGVLFSPPEMQKCIYDYLRRDEKAAAAAKTKEKKAVPTVKPVLKQEVEPALEPVLNEDAEPVSETVQGSLFDEEGESAADEQLMLV